MVVALVGQERAVQPRRKKDKIIDVGYIKINHIGIDMRSYCLSASTVNVLSTCRCNEKVRDCGKRLSKGTSKE